MEVEVIKANNSFDGSAKIDKKKIRVAAYCRVSTDDEEQIKSYDSMVMYYTDLIKKKKEWEFVGVYADKASTGTKAKTRPGFQKLIADCMDGQIDMILAKSLSRFARNTLDTIKYVRMLKEKGIAVCFEVENLNTLKDGEFLLTILSSVAQQEVENTSAYVKKGLKMKMKRGELVGFQGCIGYDYHPETKTLTVNEEGAEVVRWIFDRYIEGAGCNIISRELNQRGIKTIRGNEWCGATVLGIIKNEKYKGDILQGKTITVDPISKRRIDNMGEEERYYVREHHEPIIDADTFEAAQAILRKRRGGKRKADPEHRVKYSRMYAFSSILECAYCGAAFSRRVWHSSSQYKKIIWQCSNHTKNGLRYCPDSKGIPEQIIEEAFVESYRLLNADNDDILERFMKKMEATIGKDSAPEKIKKTNASIEECIRKRKTLLERFLADTIPEEVYKDADADYEEKIQLLEAKMKQYEADLRNEEDLKTRLAKFRKTLSTHQVLTEFNREVFDSVIEKILVGGYDEEGNKDPYKITFIYKNGYSNGMGDVKKKYRKRKKKSSDSGVVSASKLPSNYMDNASKLLSIDKADTRRGCLFAFQGRCKVTEIAG